MTQEEWVVLNRERGELIDRSINGTITPEDEGRLDELQKTADAHLDKNTIRTDE